MRIINTQTITDTVATIIQDIACNINAPCLAALDKACSSESNSTAKFALQMMTNNAAVARDTMTPVCQDTGMCVVFIDYGKDVFFEGELLSSAVNRGVKIGYSQLRKSVTTPLTRQNTGDNTPAVIHSNIVDGDKVTISVMLKGFGSENMSRLYMLTPAAGLDGVKKAIIDTAQSAGSNPCPPMILGVGIGGTMEYAAIMSKRALLRQVGSVNTSKMLDELENSLKIDINRLNIGAQGFHGDTSCLAVFIEEYPTHISSIPVAINVLCHCQRSATVIL